MILILKLTDGSEIIGDVTKTGDGVLINEPLAINYRQRMDSIMPQAGLIRYCPFSKQSSIRIYNDHIITSMEPIPAMARFYQVALKTVIESMDEAVDTELHIAAGEELSNEDKAKMAYLERLATKRPLN
jgi:hypothetical protein